MDDRNTSAGDRPDPASGAISTWISVGGDRGSRGVRARPRCRPRCAACLRGLHAPQAQGPPKEGSHGTTEDPDHGRQRADRRAGHARPLGPLRVQRPRRDGRSPAFRTRRLGDGPRRDPAGVPRRRRRAPPGDFGRRRQLGRPGRDHGDRDAQRVPRGAGGRRRAGRVHEQRQHDVRLGVGRRAAVRPAGERASGTA